MSIPESFRKSFDDWAQKNALGSILNITPLAGDGSTRSFYRAATKGGSYILLTDPEWRLSADYPAIQSQLLKVGLPVPAFLGGEKKSGFLVMEDLGDALLQLEIEKNPNQKMPWLIKAAILLAELHGKASPVPKNSPVASRRFDSEKYFSELLFTEEHLIQKYLGLDPWPEHVKSSLKSFCKHLSQFTPDVFCHRDYHTRNILVFQNRLWLIDFQDARLGSPQYDLSSLVYDAYQPMTDEERSTVIEAYKKTIRTFPIAQSMSWKEFDAGLERVAFQRVLKAAGSFASFFTRHSKSTHLKYLLPALDSAILLAQKDTQLCGALGKELEIQKWREKVKNT